MDFFSNFKKPQKGGYIFLSHSHDDIEKVRQIRNSFEADGFEPLCFYLKCLEDENEIEDLIKREIDAREWFVFVNSENSKKSKWVNLEREYINRTDAKKIITIDINDENSITEAVQKIRHNLRVFFSCSHKDIEMARRIKNRLAEKDYLVFLGEDCLPPNERYAEKIRNEITEASKDGCVFVLITPNYIKSRWGWHEIELAFDEGGKIIPVVVGDVELTPYLKLILLRSHVHTYHLSENPSDEEIDKMIDEIGRSIVG